MRSALISGCSVMLAAGLLGCGSSGTDTTTVASDGTTITAPGGSVSTDATTASTTATAPTATGAVPANASFAARADAVCTRHQSERRDILAQLRGQFRQSGGTAGAASNAADVYRQAVASGRRELDELRGLPEPPSQASAIHDYFSSAETTLDDLDKLAGALEEPRSGALRSAGPEIRADGMRAYRLARGLGLRVCGELR